MGRKRYSTKRKNRSIYYSLIKIILLHLCYDYNNYILHCNDSIQLIDNTFDAFFIDPPWGGPDYKKQNNLKLQLSNIDMVDMVKLIPSNKLIILKLPFNHYIDDITKHYKLLYKLEIKNILVLYLINTIIE